MLTATQTSLLAVISFAVLASMTTAVDLSAPCKCHETADACNDKNQALRCNGVENGKWEFDEQCAGDEICTEVFYRVFDFQEPSTDSPGEQLRASCAAKNPGPPPSIACDPSKIKSYCSDDLKSSSWGCDKMPNGSASWVHDHFCSQDNMDPKTGTFCHNDVDHQAYTGGPLMTWGMCNPRSL